MRLVGRMGYGGDSTSMLTCTILTRSTTVCDLRLAGRMMSSGDATSVLTCFDMASTRKTTRIHSYVSSASLKILLSSLKEIELYSHLLFFIL